MLVAKDKSSFNFEDFKNQAILDMKAGRSLVGKDGIFTPLMKEFLEAALEGEMTSHRLCCKVFGGQIETIKFNCLSCMDIKLPFNETDFSYQSLTIFPNIHLPFFKHAHHFKTFIAR